VRTGSAALAGAAGCAWGTLEEYVRAWAKKYGHVHVLTGSVFDRDGDGQPDGLGQTRWTKPSKRVGVPSHFFKILLRETSGGELVALTVLLPNKSTGLGKGEAFLRQNLTSVTRIRRLSRTDFFPGAQRRHQGSTGAGCGV